MLLKTEGGLQPGHRPQKQLSSFHSTTLASRGRVAKTPPLIENIFCPALIIGESSRSGRGLGLISFWDETLNCRAVSERKFSACSRFEIRAENGRLHGSYFSLNRSCVVGCDHLDPPFSGGNFLSGLDNGRDRRIRVQSGLR